MFTLVVAWFIKMRVYFPMFSGLKLVTKFEEDTTDPLGSLTITLKGIFDGSDFITTYMFGHVSVTFTIEFFVSFYFIGSL
jgi:hypothetical protein